MKLDKGSLILNVKNKSRGNTPAWGTALGQGKDYKINEPALSIVEGMVYSSVKPNIAESTINLGKSNSVDASVIVLFSVFDKIMVNGKTINNCPLCLLLARDISTYHAGRLTLKYSNNYVLKVGNKTIDNNESFKIIAEKVWGTREAAWFVHDIDIAEQNILVMKAIKISDKSVIFENGSEQKEKINELLRSEESSTLYSEAKNLESFEDFRKTEFIKWARNNIKDSKTKASSMSSFEKQYIPKMNLFLKEHCPDFPFVNVFSVEKPSDIQEILNRIINNKELKDLDEKNHRVYSSGFKHYLEFLNDLKNDSPYNLICFGAPGTGKSYSLNLKAFGKDSAYGYFRKENIRRVTFHPEYSYSQFVGCYKPSAKNNNADNVSYYIFDGTEYKEANVNNNEITYKYEIGPFLETYIEAIKNPHQNYVLIIEEINRANPAGTFGDLIQILDRDSNGRSEYKINIPKTLKQELAEVMGLASDDENCNWLRLPDNLYLWATMNSADQGVYPMDTAFKRRWDFSYLGIDNNEHLINSATLKEGSHSSNLINWNAARKFINKLMADAEINEDKWIGPFFIKPELFSSEAAGIQAFKDKVLLYLYEDAAKSKRTRIFSQKWTYSELCYQFDMIGMKIFAGEYNEPSSREDHEEQD